MLPRPVRKVTPGPEKREIPPGARPDDYCLIVSALAPYKKVEVAMAACEKLGMELRIVGTGPERERLEEMAGERVRFLGHVGQEALRDLYRGARFFLQPGVEDFGIASVEALACGTPVVAVARGGIERSIDDSGFVVVVDLIADDLGALIAPDQRMVAAAGDVGGARGLTWTKRRYENREQGDNALAKHANLSRDPALLRRFARPSRSRAGALRAPA